jgi:Arc/MetJ-type ribon-helix-helix transcriptional regulator
MAALASCQRTRRRLTGKARSCKLHCKTHCVLYAGKMVQLVTRVDDDLATAIDELVAQGSVSSRSDAVRRGLEQLVEGHRRRLIGQQIRDGYLQRPQTEEELAGSDAAAAAMIEEEPW